MARLFAVVGATGTGKSEFSLDLAEAIARSGGSAEIVGADAMQLYRGMDIGTAKLPEAQRRGIPHHMIDVLDPAEDAAVAWYQHAAREAIRGIHERGADAILVGGSGLYVSSVIYDFHFPPRDEALRAKLEAELAEHGIGPLFARLSAQDPVTASRIDPRNERRVIRALEVLAQGAETHRASLPEAPVLWWPETTLFGMRTPREELVTRLDHRVELMWRDGIVEETRGLRDRGVVFGTTAARAIGYSQALAQLGGQMTETEAIAETQALTRRYARRQVSWFARYAAVTWQESGAADADTALEAANVEGSRPR